MFILHFIYQLGNKGRIIHTKNSTKEDQDCNPEGEGIRRCSVYVFNDPTQHCYTQFFVGGKQPEGLRIGILPLSNIRYICQPPKLKDLMLTHLHTYYATMFDEAKGIAVFSAYKLTQQTTDFNNYPERYKQEWYPTPGNLLTCTQKLDPPLVKVPTCMRVQSRYSALLEGKCHARRYY